MYKPLKIKYYKELYIMSNIFWKLKIIIIYLSTQIIVLLTQLNFDENLKWNKYKK